MLKFIGKSRKHSQEDIGGLHEKEYNDSTDFKDNASSKFESKMYDENISTDYNLQNSVRGTGNMNVEKQKMKNFATIGRLNLYQKADLQVGHGSQISLDAQNIRMLPFHTRQQIEQIVKFVNNGTKCEENSDSNSPSHNFSGDPQFEKKNRRVHFKEELDVELFELESLDLDHSDSARAQITPGIEDLNYKSCRNLENESGKLICNEYSGEFEIKLKNYDDDEYDDDNDCDSTEEFVDDPNEYPIIDQGFLERSPHASGQNLSFDAISTKSIFGSQCNSITNDIAASKNSHQVQTSTNYKKGNSSIFVNSSHIRQLSAEGLKSNQDVSICGNSCPETTVLINVNVNRNFSGGKDLAQNDVQPTFLTFRPDCQTEGVQKQCDRGLHRLDKARNSAESKLYPNTAENSVGLSYLTDLASQNSAIKDRELEYSGSSRPVIEGKESEQLSALYYDENFTQCGTETTEEFISMKMESHGYCINNNINENFTDNFDTIQCSTTFCNSTVSRNSECSNNNKLNNEMYGSKLNSLSENYPNKPKSSDYFEEEKHFSSSDEEENSVNHWRSRRHFCSKWKHQRKRTLTDSSINQPINQSIDGSINQSNNESVCHSQSGRSINRSCGGFSDTDISFDSDEEVGVLRDGVDSGVTDISSETASCWSSQRSNNTSNASATVAATCEHMNDATILGNNNNMASNRQQEATHEATTDCRVAESECNRNRDRDMTGQSLPDSSSGIASTDDPSLSSLSPRDNFRCKQLSRDPHMTSHNATSSILASRASQYQATHKMMTSQQKIPHHATQQSVTSYRVTSSAETGRMMPHPFYQSADECRKMATPGYYESDLIESNKYNESYNDLVNCRRNREFDRFREKNPQDVIEQGNGAFLNNGCDLDGVNSTNSSIQPSFYADEIRRLAEGSRRNLMGQQLSSNCTDSKYSNRAVESGESCTQYEDHSQNTRSNSCVKNNFELPNHSQQVDQMRSNTNIQCNSSPSINTRPESALTSAELHGARTDLNYGTSRTLNHNRYIGRLRESPASMMSESAAVYRSYPSNGLQRMPSSIQSSCTSIPFSSRPSSVAANEIGSQRQDLFSARDSVLNNYTCRNSAGKFSGDVNTAENLNTNSTRIVCQESRQDETLPPMSPRFGNDVDCSPRRNCTRRYRRQSERTVSLNSNAESDLHCKEEANNGSNFISTDKHTRDDSMKRLRPSSRLSAEEQADVSNFRATPQIVNSGRPTHKNLSCEATQTISPNKSIMKSLRSNVINPNRNCKSHSALTEKVTNGGNGITLDCNRTSGISSEKPTDLVKQEGFLSLPDSVIHKIFAQGLHSDDLCRTARVCKRFYRIVWSPTLWKSIVVNNPCADIDKALDSLTTILSEHTPTVCLGLERVVLSGCTELTDKGLYLIAQRCIDLCTLVINGCDRVSNIAMFEIVSRCVSLTHLDVSGCAQISCISLTPEANIQATTYGKQILLRHLDMSECMNLDDSGLQLIVSYCTHLTHVYLRRCIKVGDLGIQYLATYCTNLKELSISDCTRVTDLGVRELARLETTLKYLSIAKCEELTDKGIRLISESCPRLRYLNARGCSKITDSSIITLANSCRTRLRSLDVGKSGITDRTLNQLALRCPSLRKLSLRGCEGISGGGVVELARGCPGLRQLNIQDCLSVTLENFRDIRRICRNCVIEHTNPAFF